MPSACPVLWWNNTVLARIGGKTIATVLPTDGDLGAFCSFVRGLDPRPRAIRLFYHSAAVEHFATPCPKGSRRTVQRALSHRTPALSDPATPWAAHVIGDSGNGTTLLYVEPQGRLSRARTALAGDGIHLEAAIPLLVLIEETTSPDDRQKPRLVLLTSKDAAAVYWITPAGDRHAAFFDGATARARIGRELIEGFSIFKSAPVFTVVNFDSAPPDLNRLVEESLPQSPSQIRAAGDLLDGAESLRIRDVCNYLPPGSPVTFDHLCQLAALGFFFASALLGTSYLSAIRSARANLTAQHAEEQQLETEIGRLRGNQAVVRSAQVVLDEAAVASPVKLRFLETLNRARPIQISIQSATLAESSWTVVGRVHEGAGLDKGPFQAFLAALQKDGGWTIGSDYRPPNQQEPDFALTGTFP